MSGLEKRPGELEIVWNDDGKSIKGLSLKSHIYFDNEYMRTVGPEPIATMDDPIVSALAERFSSQAVAERDAAIVAAHQAKESLDAKDQELQQALAANVILTEQLASVRAELDKTYSERCSFEASLQKTQQAAREAEASFRATESDQIRQLREKIAAIEGVA